MALTVTEMATDLQSQLGKGSDDSLITPTKCIRWLNQAQNDIIDQWPNLRDVGVRDKTTWVANADQYEYNLKHFVDKPVAHIRAIIFINTTTSDYPRIQPYPGGPELFDYDFPYVPDLTAGVPEWYIQRDYTIKFAPPFGSSEDGKAIWIDYAYRPRVMSSTDTATLTRFDEILIQWAKSYAYAAMPGLENDAVQQLLYAEALAERRVDGEMDYDQINAMPEDGPF